MAAERRVLAVGWEGAEWSIIHSLIDSGEMPHLAAIVNNGVAGDLITLQPQLGPLLWTSLATGCRADKHGVLSSLQVNGESVRATSAGDRQRPALWDITSAAELRTHVIGWPTYPAEKVNGTFVSHLFSRLAGENYLDLPRSVIGSDVDFESLRIHPRELSHRELLPFVPRAAGIDQNRDPGLAIIATWLAEWTTTHMAATAILEADDWDCGIVCYDAIDRFSHAFMRFHPPRSRSVTHAAFELYRVVMAGVYRYADMQLGRLIELAGPEATVVVFSDHGFRTGSDRPTTTGQGRNNVAWHRPLGVLAMRGPLIRRDEWIWGPSILDLCPTVLSALGVDYQGKMDGHTLTQGFVNAVPTIHTVNVIDPTHLESLTEEENAAVLARFADEGFLTEQQLIGDHAAQEAAEASDFNLATVYSEKRELAQAVELYRRLIECRPDCTRYWVQLANCQLALGEFDACQDSLEQAEQHGLAANVVHRTRGSLLRERGDYPAALEQLFLAEQSAPHQVGIHAQIGEVYLALKNYEEAKRAFSKEIEHNADSPRARFGLGEIALSNQMWDDALEHFLSSVALQPFQPLAHCRIGELLTKIGRHADAIRAFQRSLAQNPRNEEARDHLAKLSSVDS